MTEINTLQVAASVRRLSQLEKQAQQTEKATTALTHAFQGLSKPVKAMQSAFADLNRVVTKSQALNALQKQLTAAKESTVHLNQAFQQLNTTAGQGFGDTIQKEVQTGETAFSSLAETLAQYKDDALFAGLIPDAMLEKADQLTSAFAALNSQLNQSAGQTGKQGGGVFSDLIPEQTSQQLDAMTQELSEFASDWETLISNVQNKGLDQIVAQSKEIGTDALKDFASDFGKAYGNQLKEDLLPEDFMQDIHGVDDFFDQLDEGWDYFTSRIQEKGLSGLWDDALDVGAGPFDDMLSQLTSSFKSQIVDTLVPEGLFDEFRQLGDVFSGLGWDGATSFFNQMFPSDQTTQSGADGASDGTLDATRQQYDSQTGLELDLTEQRESQKAQIESQYQQTRLQSATDFFNNIAALAVTSGGKQSKIAKAAAVAQATMKTYESATGAYAALAGIPYVGPALGAAAAAAAVAAGMANIQAIRSANFSGAYDHGGHIPSGKIGLVGEYGPELIAGPASVTSRRTTADQTSGAASSTSHVSFAPVIQISGQTDGSARQTAQQVRSTLQGLMAEFITDQQRSGGMLNQQNEVS
ncbi:hypothetical protein VA7868_03922 [Vibrio aerogenes CECT 7868]|uniref:Uncharacterized protein n=1 Tax=Vibrio aerogenes CECT 7868 TaxID=1216006 RepID=A0A1M6C2D4_9VIBR|nr:hypothetical protein [Vibrio aerogenes]SHI54868.1 hypothetical protein VA7868_03922 [Vibrio aerogenes CECT 7868]